MEYREQFMELGGEYFGLVPCLNDNDEHARLLGEVIQSQLRGWV